MSIKIAFIGSVKLLGSLNGRRPSYMLHRQQFTLQLSCTTGPILTRLHRKVPLVNLYIKSLTNSVHQKMVARGRGLKLRKSSPEATDQNSK